MNISASAKGLALFLSALILAPGAALAADEPASQAKPMPSGMMGHDKMEGHEKMMPAPKDKMKMGASCMSMSNMQKMGMSKKKTDQMKQNCDGKKMTTPKPVSDKARPAPMKPH